MKNPLKSGNNKKNAIYIKIKINTVMRIEINSLFMGSYNTN